jgi:23S rRNA (adenine2503-C2)-methyltransferase
LKWIYDLTYRELKDDLLNKEFKPYTVNQIFSWIFNKGIADIDKWSNISKTNRENLKRNYNTEYSEVVEIKEDNSGTKKFLIKLQDSELIESVLIPEKMHYTFCISTQIGCPLKCSFCETGKMGFIRNLTSGEIISQILILKESLIHESKINLVFMGMGEPLLNYKNLKRALSLITSPSALSISPRSITVSTAGILAGIKELERDFPNLKISFSLNASNISTRKEIMPVSKKQDLNSILSYFRNSRRKHRITFEYVMLKDINDSLKNAGELTKLLRGIKCKINLIPYNSNNTGFSQPEAEDINEFARYLRNKNLTITTRWSKGDGINSACGQLAVHSQ